MSAWGGKYKGDFPSRVVFALNQHYPELRSGHYLNKRLIALIQDSLADLGLFVVIEENYRKEGTVPVELSGSLELADDYLLVDDSLSVRGRLRIWESLGGKSEYYHDNVLLEMATQPEIADRLIGAVQNTCCLRNVTFSRK